MAGNVTVHGQYIGIVEAKTADYTIDVTADNGKTFTNTGASGTISIQLPAATVGQRYRFALGAAQQLRIEPSGSETISLPSTGVAESAGDYIVADAIGETCEIQCCVAGTWNVFGFTGTWTGQ